MINCFELIQAIQTTNFPSYECWPSMRDQWMKELGISGTIIRNRKYNYIPDSIELTMNFYFDNSEDELAFRLKYSIK